MRPPRKMEYPPGFKPQRKRVQIQWEFAEQQAVVAWARSSSARYPELKLLYSIPNGRGINIVTRIKMAKEGANPGIPDLCLPVARGRYHGFYGEMKAINRITGREGKTEPEQVEKQFLLKNEGYYVCQEYRHEDMQIKIMAYLKLGPFRSAI